MYSAARSHQRSVTGSWLPSPCSPLVWPDFLPALSSGRGANTGQSATACVCPVWARTAEHNPRVLRRSLLTNRDQMEICSTVSPAPRVSFSVTLSFKTQVSLEQGLARTEWLLRRWQRVRRCLCDARAPAVLCTRNHRRTPRGPGGAAAALLSTAGPHALART